MEHDCHGAAVELNCAPVEAWLRLNVMSDRDFCSQQLSLEEIVVYHPFRQYRVKCECRVECSSRSFISGKLRTLFRHSIPATESGEW